MNTNLASLVFHGQRLPIKCVFAVYQCNNPAAFSEQLYLHHSIIFPDLFYIHIDSRSLLRRDRKLLTQYHNVLRINFQISTSILESSCFYHSSPSTMVIAKKRCTSTVLASSLPSSSAARSSVLGFIHNSRTTFTLQTSL